VENKIEAEINRLINNQSIIENKIKELEMKASAIEKEINESYYKNLEKVRDEKGKRIAILNFQSSKFQKEMINIQEIIAFNNEYTKNKNDIFSNRKNDEDKIEYLLKCRNVIENIESIISKPLNDITIEEGIETMPVNEIMETLKMENYQKLKTVLKLKNDIIWNLILMRKKLPETHLKQFKEKQNRSMNRSINKSIDYNANANTNNNNNPDTYHNSYNDINNAVSLSRKSNEYNNFSNEINRSNRFNGEEMNDLDVKNSIDIIKYFVRKNNFNLYQLLSEKCMEKNKDYITKDNLLVCLHKINIDINDEQLTRLLIKYDLFENYSYVPINDFLKLLAN
jgi:hypothetical protein